MQGGQGRFRFLPLGPPAPPVTPLKRSLREGYGTVRRVCTALKGATMKRGSRRRSRLRGNNSRHLATPSCSPFGHSLRSCPLSPHAGTAFGWCYRQPALKGEVDASKASRRRGCSVAALVYVNPSVALRRQLPVRGAFGRYTQTLVQSRRAANDGPYSTSYKPLAKTRGRTASTISSQSLTLTRRKADFTLRKQYFTARQRNFTRS